MFVEVAFSTLSCTDCVQFVTNIFQCASKICLNSSKSFCKLEKPISTAAAFPFISFCCFLCGQIYSMSDCIVDFVTNNVADLFLDFGVNIRLRA